MKDDPFDDHATKGAGGNPAGACTETRSNLRSSRYGNVTVIDTVPV